MNITLHPEFLIVSFILLIFYSCSGKKEFNISSSESAIDTVKMGQMMDSLQQSMEQNFHELFDTNTASLGGLGDSEKWEKLNERVLADAERYMKPVFEELEKPYRVNDVKREVVHFSIFNIHKMNFNEMEISEKEFLYRDSLGIIKAMPVNPLIWARAKDLCQCGENDNMMHLLKNDISNLGKESLYRMDLTTGGTYNYCWKVYGKNDVLNEILKLKDGSSSEK